MYEEYSNYLINTNNFDNSNFKLFFKLYWAFLMRKGVK